VDARGVLMKEKKLCPNISDYRLFWDAPSEWLEVGKVVDSPEAKTALETAAVEFAQFFANALSDSRDRRFRELSPAGDRQES